MVTTSELQEAIQRVRARTRRRWKEKLESAVRSGFSGQMMMSLDSLDLHELYTTLVDSDGPEGCSAGSTELPEGWCKACDNNRKLRKER